MARSSIKEGRADPGTNLLQGEAIVMNRLGSMQAETFSTSGDCAARSQKASIESPSPPLFGGEGAEG